MPSKLRPGEKQVLRFAQDDKCEGEAYQHKVSERPFLREAEAGQRDSFGGFCDLHLHHRRVRRRDFGRSQHRVLREHFAVHLGDKVILAGCILAPDLSEFNRLYGHSFSLGSQTTHRVANPSIAGELLLWERPGVAGPGVLSGIGFQHPS